MGSQGVARVLLHKQRPRSLGLSYRKLTDIHFSEYVFAFFTNKEVSSGSRKKYNNRNIPIFWITIVFGQGLGLSLLLLCKRPQGFPVHDDQREYLCSRHCLIFTAVYRGKSCNLSTIIFKIQCDPPNTDRVHKTTRTSRCKSRLHDAKTTTKDRQTKRKLRTENFLYAFLICIYVLTGTLVCI